MERFAQGPARRQPEQPGARRPGRPARLRRRCIAAGFAVTAEPVLAQAIKTSMDGLDGGDVKIGDIPAYYAVPKGKGKRPVVVVVAEIWGKHEYIKDVCAASPRPATSRSPTSRTSASATCAKLDDIKEVLAGANKLSDQQAFEDLDAVVAWAGKHPRANVAKLGITGFCRGGRMVWMYTAHNKKVDAGVAWYGSLDADPAGEADRRRWTSPTRSTGRCSGSTAAPTRASRWTHVERMRAGLKAFGNDKKSTIHVYEGMPHAFNADYRPSYRKEAADDGWKRMLAWFKKNGVA